MTFLRNAWYVAAWDDEVPVGKPLARTLLNEPVVLFRTDKGVRALFDRCPHRFAPLHLGRQEGDGLRCPYHGLEFDGAGVCTRNPHGDGRIPGAARVRSYPLVERDSVLWIWMGDAEKADPGLIPRFASLDPEGWYVAKDYLLTKAHYQLDVDNIMDLSHIDYLHASTLGNGSSKNAETKVVQDGDTVYSLRLNRNERLSPELERRNGLEPGTLVDRWLDVRWDPPGVLELEVGNAPAGADDPRKAPGQVRHFQHLFSPETEHTTHYWFATSRRKSLGPDGARIVAEMITFLRGPFETEDLPMLEAQQAAMGTTDFWALKPILLATDAPAVRARRVLDSLIRAERGRDATTTDAGSGKGPA